MSPHAQRELETIPDEIVTALDRVGDALASFDVDALVAAEPAMSDLAERLARLNALNADQRERLAPALVRARDALTRCQRLGAAVQSLAAETYALSAPAYEREGTRAPRPHVHRMEAKG
ncbi:MAG: hypothetical protein U0Q12_23565 [Vicinamibacterales bacterium]